MSPCAWTPKKLQWRIEPVFSRADDVAREAGTSPLVAQVLANRGLTDPEAIRAFLAPKLSDLHDPAELAGCTAATQQIADAARDGQRIVLYGDYDVDGMTGVAILYTCLKTVNANVDVYVPHRLEEGYGMHVEAVEALARDGAKLIVTVDCGIGATDAVRAARDAGADVIITDHHTPPADLPDATIVHPAVPAGAYPFADLAGAGVAFKLAWQVARELCGASRVDETMREFLIGAMSLAALGTIADVVPLVGENRIIATYGLGGLPRTQHPGIRALIDAAGLDGERLDAYHVGFVLAPRLNAAGRMGHAQEALELLIGRAGPRCKQIAEALAQQNAERQKVERAITAQAVDMAEAANMTDDDHRAIVLACDEWHAGVIGIVASRLVDRFHRPAVMIAINGDGVGQGSCRSIRGLHMGDALAACADHLLSFGGHAMAAGLKIDPANVPAFTEAFVRHANTALTVEDLAPSLRIDAETTLGYLHRPAVEDLTRLAPFGQGNPPPVVAVRGCQIVGDVRRLGQNGQTLSMLLGQGETTLRAVGFRMGDLVDQLVGVRTVDVAGEPQLNTFRGRTNVELKLKDVAWE